MRMSRVFFAHLLTHVIRKNEFRPSVVTLPSSRKLIWTIVPEDAYVDPGRIDCTNLKDLSHPDVAWIEGRAGGSDRRINVDMLSLLELFIAH